MRTATDASSTDREEPLAARLASARIEIGGLLWSEREELRREEERREEERRTELRRASSSTTSNQPPPAAPADTVGRVVRQRPSLDAHVIVAGEPCDVALTNLNMVLLDLGRHGPLRVLPNDLDQLHILRRAFTASQLAELSRLELGSQLSRAVERQVQRSTVVWSDESKGQRVGSAATWMDSLPFVCVRVQLELGLVLPRIRSPPFPISCFGAFTGLKIAVKAGRVSVVRFLLQHTPELLDFDLHGTRETGTYDTEPLFIACSADGLREGARLLMVRTLLDAYQHRAQDQQFTGAIFAAMHRSHSPFYQASFEYRALKVAMQRGFYDCAHALAAAGVPVDCRVYTDPTERAFCEAIVANDHASAAVITSRQLTQKNGYFTEAEVQSAQQRFGGNSPMAFGFLIGTKGVVDNPPPQGWASLDPDGAKATALRDAVMRETRLRNYESRLVHIETQRLRDELVASLRDQGPQRHGDELLVFVCNPKNTRHALPQALNDALAASHGMAASIIGGVSNTGLARFRPAVEPARVEDNTCTLECLEKELVNRQAQSRLPSAFLFSGHADASKDGRPKTLGFTLADGTLAPLVDAEDVVTLLSRYARRAGARSGIELVVLNGCKSCELGRACHRRGVPVVVGWRTLVCDESAYLFARGFFRSLGASDRGDGCYRRAFEAGKRAVTEVQRTVRDLDGDGVVEVPFFELYDPESEGVRRGLLESGSFAAGVPVLYDATSPEGHC